MNSNDQLCSSQNLNCSDSKSQNIITQDFGFMSIIELNATNSNSSGPGNQVKYLNLNTHPISYIY